ncbi:p29 [Carrot yellow leaf virus]|uniref:p29 n=1 Tax=Carrot yellow leaf virus TaxID=656190 RepID=C6GFK0_9CLOS|nr:p29 [Carrot yellow leaf virus]ACT10245.1 p29 [Carrot yellow leaf virus]
MVETTVYSFDAASGIAQTRIGDFLTILLKNTNVPSSPNRTRRWCVWLSLHDKLYEVVFERGVSSHSVYTVDRDISRGGDIYGETRLEVTSFNTARLDLVVLNSVVRVFVSVDGKSPVNFETSFIPDHIGFGSESVFSGVEAPDDLQCYATTSYSSSFNFKPSAVEKILLTHSPPNLSIFPDSAGSVSRSNERSEAHHSPIAISIDEEDFDVSHFHPNVHTKRHAEGEEKQKRKTELFACRNLWIMTIITVFLFILVLVLVSRA